MTVQSGRILVLGAPLLLSLAVPARADNGSSRDAQYSADSRTRGLVGGWGHSWRPVFGQTRSEIAFVAFTPRMGWFLAERLEIYGEGTLFVYDRPQAAIAAGPQLAGRYYLKTHGGWIPYVHGGGGLLWTSLDVPEIDRIFNFQLVMGVGWRQNRPSGPCWVFEFRNHHISNAGTGPGKNLGVNAATVLTGIEWVLRPSR